MKARHNIQTKLPDFFKPLFWSYDFSSMNPIRDKKSVILNTINYGDLNHWRWIVKFYGKDEVANVLKETPASAIRARARELAKLIFSIKEFAYVQRSVRE